MTRIELILGGKPTPQARPRMLRSGICYNPQAKEMKAAKRALLMQMQTMGVVECPLELQKRPVKAITGLGLYDPSLRARNGPQGPLELIEGPIHLDITFHMPIPLSWSKVKKVRMDGQPHVSKPDIDNLIKFSLDCMNGIVYSDDRFIWSINAKKVYSSIPRTHITITYDY